MKIKFVTTNTAPGGFTTVGYWRWSEPQNKGTLIIEVARFSDWRYSLAVWGHELIEALYCKLRGITTEECDNFDALYEEGYADGSIAKEKEAGDDRRCPYHWGHMAGVCWEYICIYGTLASWRGYAKDCYRVMGVDA